MPVASQRNTLKERNSIITLRRFAVPRPCRWAFIAGRILQHRAKKPSLAVCVLLARTLL